MVWPLSALKNGHKEHFGIPLWYKVQVGRNSSKLLWTLIMLAIINRQTHDGSIIQSLLFYNLDRVLYSIYYFRLSSICGMPNNVWLYLCKIKDLTGACRMPEIWELDSWDGLLQIVEKVNVVRFLSCALVGYLMMDVLQS
jgi:hypothetical protein